MAEALQATHSYLAQTYRDLLNIQLSEGRVDSPADNPVLIWQNAELRNVDNSENATGCVVLDPQIGVCLYVQVFSANTDLKAQMARALRVRSELLPGREISPLDADNDGEWRVALHWLVEGVTFPDWMGQLAAIREETAHFEEIPVDAIINSFGDWQRALTAHALPRFLFRTRHILAKKQPDDAAKWVSAEDVVYRKLQDIIGSEHLDESLLASFTEKLRELGKVAGPSSNSEFPTAPQELFSLTLKNFRNITDLKVILRSPSQVVSSNVIQGPNGSGKSALLEGLSLALGSVSSRYLEFLRDTNESTQGKARKYIETYLSPLRELSAIPQVALNQQPLADVTLSDPERVTSQYERISAAVFCHNEIDNLLSKPADELGAQIASGYSRLASSLIDWVQQRLSVAEAEQKNFNRQWQLNTNISREETARLRIVESLLSNSLLIPATTMQWLENSPPPIFKTTAADLAGEWNALLLNRADEFNRIARAQSRDELQTLIEHYLARRAEVIRKVSIEIQRAVAGRALLDDTIEIKVRDWGQWLQEQQDPRRTLDTPNVQHLRNQFHEASSKLDNVAKQGATVREQLKHLDSLMPFLNDYWLSFQPNKCPTCDSELNERNGLSVVVATVRAGAERKIQRLRDEYQEIKRQLDQLRAQLSAAGVGAPEISSEDQALVVDKLRGLVGNTFDVSTIAQPGTRGDLFSCFAWLRNAPTSLLPAAEEGRVKPLASQIANQSWNAFLQFTNVATAPEAWKRLQKGLMSSLAEAVKEHLPQTVQALWLELARNITPAPWQFPGDVEFDVTPKRNQTEARVLVRGPDVSPLAAHILNKAEVNTLAIGWFIARYLTVGRFRYSFVVLDDPAQHMDQPTFRDFCRLLESVVRLHRCRKLPLTLVILLHQDERALDAARATNAILHMLRWNKGAAFINTHMAMRAAAVLPRKPHAIIKSA